jgi:uncharacterized protein YbaR (Trm112 family)
VRKRNLVPRQRKKRTDSPPERLEGTIDPKLLDTPVCPISKGALQFGWTRQELTSRAARLAYPIRDGSPMTLPEKRGRSTSLAGKGRGARGMSAFACAMAHSSRDAPSGAW